MKDQNDQKTVDLLTDTDVPRSVGRPRKYADPAARQRAYRQRLKEQGKRVVSRVVRDVRDVEKPLVSDVIDLSQVRGAKGR